MTKGPKSQTSANDKDPILARVVTPGRPIGELEIGIYLGFGSLGHWGFSMSEF